MVGCFKMEPYDTKARRYALFNELCGLLYIMLKNNGLLPGLQRTFEGIQKIIIGKKFSIIYSVRTIEKICS